MKLAWDRIKAAAESANKAYKTVRNVKRTASDIKQKGLLNTVKGRISQKARKKMQQMAARGAKGVLRFLVTPPWGWAVSAVLIFLLSSGLNASGSAKGIDGGIGSGKTTEEQYAAMATGCPTDDGSGVTTSGSITLKPGQSSWSLSQVIAFSKGSYASDWGVSDSDAADLFLSKNQTVATEYGLNKNNIGKVIAAVKAEGVSPVFFFLYSVNEVGGAGGYINHYSSGAMTGDAVKDAKMDAEYLVSESNIMSGKPATGGGEPGDMPTDDASKILAQMPAGSIGRVYIKATSATTAELETLAGKHGSWSGKFGNSLQDMMTNITKLGGDVTKGKPAFASGGKSGDMTASMGADDSDTKCKPTNNDAGLKSGGLTLAEARDFMKSKYFDVPITQADIPGADPGTPDIHDNCTAFSSFFILHYTSGLASAAGNGGEKVENLVAANKGKLTQSDTPTVYSVFSIKGGNPGTTGSAGHTGVVLGIDKSKGVAIIGQAGYGMPYNASFVAEEKPLSDMTAAKGWRFTDVSKYVKGIGGK